jgi:hypothetical protein
MTATQAAFATVALIFAVGGVLIARWAEPVLKSWVNILQKSGGWVAARTKGDPVRWVPATPTGKARHTELVILRVAGIVFACFAVAVFAVSLIIGNQL